jgi:hypothetical protein
MNDPYKNEPNLKKALEDFPKRFDNPKGESKCDGDDCNNLLKLDTFNVLVTPTEHKVLILCSQCLPKLAKKYNIRFQ